MQEPVCHRDGVLAGFCDAGGIFIGGGEDVIDLDTGIEHLGEYLCCRVFGVADGVKRQVIFERALGVARSIHLARVFERSCDQEVLEIALLSILITGARAVRRAFSVLSVH